jgi:hypothetical protein
VKLKRHDGGISCKRLLKRKKCALGVCTWIGSADNVEWYKVAKKTAKRTVSETRGQMYDGLYQWLGT